MVVVWMASLCVAVIFFNFVLETECSKIGSPIFHLCCIFEHERCLPITKMADNFHAEFIALMSFALFS